MDITIGRWSIGHDTLVIEEVVKIKDFSQVKSNGNEKQYNNC